MKARTISEIKRALASQKKVAEAKPSVPPAGPDLKKTYITIPFFTPSDDVDIENITEEQKKKLVQKNKLMAGGHPITITNLKTRGAALVGQDKDTPGSGDYGWADALKGNPGQGWFSPSDFSYDAGVCYKAWIYTWVYLALTILVYIFIHPLLAVPFAWKVGHNQGQYIGGLIFGKEDMKGKVMYRTA
ncbi:MAG: hypothetical protein Q8R15_02450 [Candidatus Micrarchaeota archaeon]|nr:hypothetical protein [Candidatus Micrarchaeota archaeon]